MRADALSIRAINRATLARQLLLERVEMPIVDAVEHLVGLQAQLPLNPYVGLWSRLLGFAPDALGELVANRQVVRIVVMRGTLHLVSASDCLVLRPLMQPVLDRELTQHSEYKTAIAETDMQPVLEFVRPLLDERPHTGSQLRAAIGARFPELDAAAMAYACRNLLALVQAPPRGVWGRTAQVSSMTAEAFLGRPLATRPSIDEVVLRYFAASGPATVADLAAWSRLTGLREVVDRLRPRLRPFKDENGRELLDLPDAPRPDPDTPAPARFFPEYENLFLSYADRSRFSRTDTSNELFSGSRAVRGTVLHDGFLVGTWRLDENRSKGSTILVVDHGGRLAKRTTAAISAEGRTLLRLLAPETDHDVGFAQVD